MELESSYQLLGVLRDDGIRTYSAIEIATGQALQLHLFKADSEADRALFKALRGLPVSKRRDLLDMGTEGDQPYIVTEKLPDNVSAREWLTKLAGVQPAKPGGPVMLAGSWKTGTPIPDELIRASHSSLPPKPPPAPKPAELSADYTRVMRLPQALGAPPVQMPVGLGPAAPEPMFEAPPPVSVPPVAGTPPVFDAPAAFAAPPVPAFEPALSAPPVPTSTPARPPITESASEPGEFERFFALGQPLPATEPVVNEPGGFTGMFRTQALAATPPPVEVPRPAEPAAAPIGMAAPEPVPQVGPSSGARQPGEFTRMFQTSQVETAPPVAPPPPVVAQPLVSQPVVTQGPVTQAAIPEPGARQPGEFTRMFQTAQAAEVAQPAPPVATPPVPQVAQPLVSPASVSPASVAPPPVAPPHQPGEFTSKFLTMQPAEAATPVAPPQSTNSQPGEFTSKFLTLQTGGTAPRVVPPEPVSPPGPPNQPGSFTSSFLTVKPAQPGPVPPRDESTRLFSTAQTPTQPAPPLQGGGLQAQMPGKPALPSSEESTRLFEAVPPLPPASGLAGPPPPAREPGEFTKMFPPARPDSPGGPMVTPPAQGRGDGPSEFTRFFQSPMYPTPAGGPKAPPTSQPVVPLGPVSRPNAQPSEFTQMFGNPNRPESGGAKSPPPPGPAGPLGSSGSATGAFSLPKSFSPPPPSSAKASGPGEFTRMMAASSPATLGQPTSPSALPPEPAQKKSMMPLYIIGGAILLAIILIVLFFVLRH